MASDYPKVLLADLNTPAASRRPYEALRKAIQRMAPHEVVEAIAESGLRGRGGAGFPAGIKWRAVAAEAADEKYVVANGAEGEPGSYKDRFLLKHLPHQVIAGVLLAAYAVGARKGYIYIHHEAEDCMAAVAEALAEARREGWLGQNILGSDFRCEIETCVAGVGYVAGEETAVLRVIEGDLPKPQAKPPYPTQKGLGGKPTLVNNIETLANVPAIVQNGAAWYRTLGTSDTPGTLLLSLNGVRCPGVYEVPAGIPLREVINQVGGGVAGRIKAVLPGGFASGFLSADDLDVPLEYGALRERGSSLGAGAMHVLDESRCIVEFTWKVMKFFAAETCGQCFPCRKGTREFLQLVMELEKGEARSGWTQAMDEVFELTGRKTICGLDKAAGMAMRSALRLFPEEFEAHLRQPSCRSCSQAAHP